MEINKKWKIYKNVESSKSVRFDLSTPPLITETGLSSFTIPAKNKNTLGIGKHPVYEEIATAIIEENGYACICVDHNHQVLKYFGDVSRFLLPKVFTFDLQEVFPKPLAIAFQTASHKALKDNEKVTIKGITIPDSPHVRQVDMTVRPLQPKDTNSNIFIILLNENTDASEHLTKDALLFDSTLYVNTYMTTLEEELKATKEQLHDSIEKLAVSEENMHSFGEELLSANEEMQSSNEELQSVNEELQTINTDYQLKIRELTILNDDLNNYFRSNINGQLFVDNDMLLKKFSPTTTKHINLRDSDIGRPLNNITTNIKFSTIENDIRRVLTTGESFSQEVESDQGNWYQMKIVPYIRQSDNTQDGAIVSFNDITAMKETQRVLTQTNQSLKRINEDLDNFVYAASHDLLGPLTSIEGLMKFLHEKIDMADPDIKLFTDMIQSSIVKFKENLHELADIGKIESEMLRETKKLDISKILEEVLFSIQDKITSSKAVIIRNIQDREVVFSRKNLRSLLYNLISNAIKFKSPERIPEIHISTYRKEEFLVLQVKDNGIGIESDKIHSIFTMYKRFHHEIDGLGLGLYLVKKIVDASGGMTEVESQPGISTTFRIFFKVGTDTADA
jgi:two-component system CheB/CheR fusion protein